MVIGKGLIAQRFAGYAQNDHVVIFASGVSHSKSNDPSAFEREKTFLTETLLRHPGKQFVYFSTCSVYDPAEKESPYVLHKLQMEKIITQTAGQYRIFRLSNLAGHTGNPNTILNFLVTHIREGQHFVLWENASRNIIDIDDAYHIIDHILTQQLFENTILNIANPDSYPVRLMVQEIERFLQTDANYSTADKGIGFSIDITAITPLISSLGLVFGDQYFSNLLGKYYGTST